MKKIILENISNTLSPEVITKEQTLYLFAEIRKVLDTDKSGLSDETDETLRIFCNWVLHGKLDLKKTRDYFLHKFEPDINMSDASTDVARIIITKQSDFFRLIELRGAIQEFCRHHGLKYELITNPTHWNKFRGKLLEILMECPVLVDGDKVKRISLDYKDGKYCYCFYLKSRLLDNKNVIKVKLKI